MPKLILGDKLTAKQVKEVKAAFVYRATTENGYPQRNPYGIRTPAISDEQWLKEHAFYINTDGSLAAKPSYCEPFYLVGK